ncbi:hypothetical protein CYMTET_17180 [Cymbomonas tetramitiformis]|uniref:Uncharacterized protein n=1 Tax=Cymbomonas tetramitiformis TaxID=36881 RepID=A0AAE0GB47_9CHLO|nr:hypothetical protein CYMTET_17180 [Cymbomonas tetramitiformis]
MWIWRREMGLSQVFHHGGHDNINLFGVAQVNLLPLVVIDDMKDTVSPFVVGGSTQVGVQDHGRDKVWGGEDYPTRRVVLGAARNRTLLQEPGEDEGTG